MLRFVIRDLLWLMVVAAVANCWYVERGLFFRGRAGHLLFSPSAMNWFDG